ncbi:MAG: hypothetical protein AB4352_26780 [Hormoscilla sp.]
MSKLNNTVLALLLTLPDLEPPLTVDEQKSLNKVGDQLRIAPDHPKIEPNLRKIVEANPTWSQLFTATKTKLDGLGDNILQELLPTREEVDRVFPSEKKPVKRGEIPLDDGDEITYLKNISVPILSEPDPQSASQKGGLFNKLKEFLSNSTPSS